MAFCGRCGTGLAAPCPSCGFASPTGFAFCGRCGAGLAHGPAPSHPGSLALAPPRSYTPRHLAEKILTSRAALEGERKQVTVLFADLKGSMELLADRDPEEARAILDPVLERMIDAVHRYEGTVNQVMGDGIMALFGAPLAHEDHAVRACYAALRMQESVAQYAEGVFRAQGVPLQIRVGLNSGEVIVRAIGSDLRMDYTAVGQATHLAARMEQMATPGTILVAPATLALAEGYVQVTARGPVAIKGLSDPLEVFVLTGPSAQRGRLHAAAARGLTRFVGRDAEIEQIHRALARARDGHGQLVAVVGEPGVGKSRLAYEFTRSPRVRDWLVLEASPVSYGRATSYVPVIDLLRAYFRVHDRETHREIREKVTGKLLTLDRALEPILPALLALLDVPVEDAHWQALDPAQRQQRTMDAVKHLLLRESKGQPVLVVVEDLHWIDAETQAVLDALVESLPTARLLLLVNYRPGYQHGWGSKTCYSQVRLDALLPESASALLSALLGDDPGLEPLKRLLVRRGNPFFIEESIRTLVETGALIRQGGACRLTRPIQAIEVPATVQVILAARIDRLPADDKQLLQTASVIGKEVPLELLRAVAEAGEDAVHRGLAHLQAAEFLYQTRLYPDPAYTFTHALTHEVTYGTLLQDRRRALHARIVDAIERLHADRLTEHVERLAHHAVRGELWAPAVAYLRRAGARALTRSASLEAVRCFEQALAALRHLPQTRETLAQAIDLRFDLRTALQPLAEFERISGCLREAEGLARTLGDQRRLGQLSVYLCHNLWITGHPRDALADVPLEVTGTLYLGVAFLGTGDHRRAEQLLRDVLRLLEGDRSRERFGLFGFPAAMARSYLTWAAADRGQFEDGMAHGQEALRLAEALDHPYSLAFACWALAHLRITRGELGPAAGLLERGLALSRDWSLTLFSVLATGSLGQARALAGRTGDGIPLLEQAVSAAAAMGLGAFQPRFLVGLGEAHALADRLDTAGECAERALALARERGQRPWEASALRLLGDIAARRDLPEPAADHYRGALALAGELEMHPLATHCHLGLGTLHRRAGQPEPARAHLTAATAGYREAGMDWWLETAAAELKALG
jgi:class 3 adenylate cyclase/tetratricopeptide (TPR) repeat protein